MHGTVSLIPVEKNKNKIFTYVCKKIEIFCASFSHFNMPANKAELKTVDKNCSSNIKATKLFEQFFFWNSGSAGQRLLSWKRMYVCTRFATYERH
jgi:hypothetical protein